MYKALYRKYRPNKFDEVVGQDTIIKLLKNAIEKEKISHSYIFSGKHGTGKTTLAKIFAKAVNGIIDVSNDDIVNYQDIIEIDAASNNGVEDIRNIIENIIYAPTALKYKVYIIDEVHMLSTAAFNALLKTLEDAPKHVIFLLATTEIYKIPLTIISRCQVLNLNNIADSVIEKHLQLIARKEKINIKDNTLSKISRLSNGSLRDAISLLDQLSVFSENDIQDKDIANNLGYLDNNVKYKHMLDFIFSGKYADILKLIDEQVLLGCDLKIFIEGFMDYLLSHLSQKFEDKNYTNSLLYILKEVNDIVLNIKLVISQDILIKSTLIKLTNNIAVNKISGNENRDIKNTPNVSEDNYKSESKKPQSKVIDNKNNDKNVVNINLEDIHMQKILKLMAEIYLKLDNNIKDEHEDIIHNKLYIDDKISMLLSDLKIKISTKKAILFVSETETISEYLLSETNFAICMDKIKRTIEEIEDVLITDNKTWLKVRKYFASLVQQKQISNRFLELLNDKILKISEKSVTGKDKNTVESIKNFFGESLVNIIE